MGYTYNPKTSVLELYSSHNAQKTITGAGVNITLTDLPSFTWVGTPIYAFIDFIIPNYADTSGGANFLDSGGNMYLKDSGASWRLCCLVGNGCYCGANEYHAGNITFYGAYDMAQYVQNGTNMELKIDGINANANNLMLYTTRSRLRLYFSGG